MSWRNALYPKVTKKSWKIKVPTRSSHNFWTYTVVLRLCTISDLVWIHYRAHKNFYFLTSNFLCTSVYFRFFCVPLYTGLFVAFHKKCGMLEAGVQSNSPRSFARILKGYSHLRKSWPIWEYQSECANQRSPGLWKQPTSKLYYTVSLTPIEVNRIYRHRVVRCAKLFL